MVLSILISVFNEEALVVSLLERVLALELPEGVEKEVVVVDDGSSDGTVGKVEEFVAAKGEGLVRFLRHERNRGKGAGIRTAMEAARGDVLIVQDADLEYDPEDILVVIDPILAGREKVVYGSRILREKAQGRSGVLGFGTGKHPDSYWSAYMGGVAVTKWVNFLSGAQLTDEPTCYKCFHREALEGIRIECDDFAWEPEVTMKLLARGTRIAEVPISYHPRKTTEGKKINWRDGVKALRAAWRFRRS